MKNAGFLAIVWWLAWATFHYFTLIFYGQSFYVAAIDSIVSNLLLALLCTGTGFTIRYYRPDPSKTVYILAGIVILSIIYQWLLSQIMNEIGVNEETYLTFLESTFILRFTIAFFMMSLAVTIGWIIHYNNEYLEEKNRLFETNRMVKDAELTNLVQKLQPHFLFNTLNSVNALTQSNPNAARKMIQELSDFLRGSLNSNYDKFVTLRSELDQLRLYLEIEKVRFGERLKSEFEIDDHVLEMLLPPLLLQPLVENAIKFGLYDTLGQVVILIKANLEGNYLVIKVSNPFDEQTASSQPGTGFGLSALKRRLNLHYNRNDLLDLTSEKGIFTATLKIPQS